MLSCLILIVMHVFMVPPAPAESECAGYHTQHAVVEQPKILADRYPPPPLMLSARKVWLLRASCTAAGDTCALPDPLSSTRKPAPPAHSPSSCRSLVLHPVKHWQARATLGISMRHALST